MNVKAVVLMMIAVMIPLLVVASLGETLSSDWATVAEQVAFPIVLIAFVGIVLLIAVRRR